MKRTRKIFLTFTFNSFFLYLFKSDSRSITEKKQKQNKTAKTTQNKRHIPKTTLKKKITKYLLQIN